MGNHDILCVHSLVMLKELAIFIELFIIATRF